MVTVKHRPGLSQIQFVLAVYAPGHGGQPVEIIAGGTVFRRAGFQHRELVELLLDAGEYLGRHHQPFETIPKCINVVFTVILGDAQLALDHLELFAQEKLKVIQREQLKVIQRELGISKDDRENDVDTFLDRLEGLVVPPRVLTRIEEELDKLAVLETGSPKYGTTRNYLDWLTSMPWGVRSQDQLDLTHARTVLDRDHDGLADVKERIIEFLAEGTFKGDVGGSIVLLVGPPGVGKTSIGRSIAEALGREFYRFSVGGMRDEAER